MTTKPERKIEHLPGTKLTPKVLLARLMERADDMDLIAVVFKQKDSTVCTAWSEMSNLQLAGLAAVLLYDGQAQVVGDAG